jgi:hypothetical protein
MEWAKMLSGGEVRKAIERQKEASVRKTSKTDPSPPSSYFQNLAGN